MTATLASFSIENTLSTTAEALVTAASGEKRFVGKATFTNTNTTTARVVTIWRLASGGSPISTNYLRKKTIQPEKTWDCTELVRHVVQNGGTIQANQDAGTDVYADLSGVLED